ncbi:hypothetical protein TKK_0011266 [Trichogramma kaykai]
MEHSYGENSQNLQDPINCENKSNLSVTGNFDVHYKNKGVKRRRGKKRSELFFPRKKKRTEKTEKINRQIIKTEPSEEIAEKEESICGELKKNPTQLCTKPNLIKVKQEPVEGTEIHHILFLTIELDKFDKIIVFNVDNIVSGVNEVKVKRNKCKMNGVTKNTSKFRNPMFKEMQQSDRITVPYLGKAKNLISHEKYHDPIKADSVWKKKSEVH